MLHTQRYLSDKKTILETEILSYLLIVGSVAQW